MENKNIPPDIISTAQKAVKTLDTLEDNKMTRAGWSKFDELKEVPAKFSGIR